MTTGRNDKAYGLLLNREAVSSLLSQINNQSVVRKHLGRQPLHYTGTHPDTCCLGVARKNSGR